MNFLTCGYLFSCQKEVDKIVGTLAADLADEKFSAGKDTTEANHAIHNLKLLSTVFGTRLDVQNFYFSSVLSSKLKPELFIYIHTF